MTSGSMAFTSRSVLSFNVVGISILHMTQITSIGSRSAWCFPWRPYKTHCCSRGESVAVIHEVPSTDRLREEGSELPFALSFYLKNLGPMVSERQNLACAAWPSETWSYEPCSISPMPTHYGFTTLRSYASPSTICAAKVERELLEVVVDIW